MLVLRVFICTCIYVCVSFVLLLYICRYYTSKATLITFSVIIKGCKCIMQSYQLALLHFPGCGEEN